MALAAKISATELTDQVSDRFVDKYLEARLINAPGTAYVPGDTVDTVFLGFEVPIGQGGYRRQAISFAAADVLNYTDDGVALNTRATVFAQDGSATSIDFSHVALCWSAGNVMTLSNTTLPTAGSSNDGTYTNIPIDSTSGSGNSLAVDIEVSNSGATWTPTIVGAGNEYADSDTVTILEGTLAGLGIVSAGAGDFVMTVDTVSTNPDAGNILSVAQTTSAVNLNGGNEAVFYWNIKQFGFYSIAA